MVNPSVQASRLPRCLHACIPKCCYQKKKLRPRTAGPVRKVNNVAQPVVAKVNNLVPQVPPTPNNTPKRHRKLDSTGVLDYFDMKQKEGK